MTENTENTEDRLKKQKQKRNNLIVAAILSAIALIGVLVPLLHYTGLKLPQ